MRRTQSFTLIELLIVVAIIAILALIAVPNFLEAQTRSKVSRAKADIRSLATAMEAYAIDYNKYPRSNFYQLAYPVDPAAAGEQGLILLTSPIAYITSLPKDPFIPGRVFTGSGNYLTIDIDQIKIMEYYGYSGRDEEGTVGTYGPPDGDTGSSSVKWWILQCSGPDRTRCTLGGAVLTGGTPADFVRRIYDPTNGTISFGSIYRAGGSPIGPGSWAFGLIRQAQ